MILRVAGSIPDGTVRIPGSKSHTIRALFFAALSRGRSVIKEPLISGDASSAARILRQFGAKISGQGGDMTVDGFGSVPDPRDGIFDVGNSGTTLRMALSVAALSDKTVVLTGDEQIRRRPLKPLIDALGKLGASIEPLYGNGMAPVSVTGPVKGGRIEIECITSQYLSSLLTALPLAEGDSVIIPTMLNERPYVDITLWWLDKMGVSYKREGYKSFYIKGGQEYRGFECAIPGDYSSATFFAVLAAASGGRVVLQNLERDDPQGDKGVLDIIRDMGADVDIEKNEVTVRGNRLRGMDIDLNHMPDALPSFAVMGCFAQGVTRIMNVPQARFKETDRIHVMKTELEKMGARIYEMEDGLEIRHSELHSADVESHGDHRVAMALAVAGALCRGVTRISGAEAIDVTFPGFAGLMKQTGVDMEII